ncbi:MAG: hypothetical protein AAF268_07430 [Cyanobacteria bacterium P01_A01_bin.3]
MLATVGQLEFQLINAFLPIFTFQTGEKVIGMATVECMRRL